MSRLAKVLKTIAVLGGVLVVALGLLYLAGRRSLLYMTIPALVVVPLSYFFRRGFGLTCGLFMGVGIALAVIPVDLVVRNGDHASVRLLQVHYGFSCGSRGISETCLEEMARRPPYVTSPACAEEVLSSRSAPDWECYGCEVPALLPPSWALVVSY